MEAPLPKGFRTYNHSFSAGLDTPTPTSMKKRLGLFSDEVGSGNDHHRHFNQLKSHYPDLPVAERLRKLLSDNGFTEDDPRLKIALDTLGELEEENDSEDLSFDQFVEVFEEAYFLYSRALERKLVIPKFVEFKSLVESVYNEALQERGGKPFTSIPKNTPTNPDAFGLAICTTDGQQICLGDWDSEVSLHSIANTFSYCMALKDQGSQVVHDKIGWESSGKPYNHLSLKSAEDGKYQAHNPMINSGALMCSHLIHPGQANCEKFEHFIDTLSRMSAGSKINFDNSMYLSELECSSERNLALLYMMVEKGIIPTQSHEDAEGILRFYLQTCSIKATCRDLSVMAATLAKGGICPKTGEKIFDSDIVRCCLSQMSSSGMNESSGEWAFTVKVPSKSSISGLVMAVIPNVMGIALYSPRLDESANSARAFKVLSLLSKQLFAVDTPGAFKGAESNEEDLEAKILASHVAPEDIIARDSELLACAGRGDLRTIRKLVAQGYNLDTHDYDNRTPLHLAAAEGHVDVVRYLLCRKVTTDLVDRWGRTPVQEAERMEYFDIIKLIQAAQEDSDDSILTEELETEPDQS